MKEVRELLDELQDEKLKKRCIVMYEDKLREQFEYFPASTRYHHAGQGDLGRHVQEVMNIAVEMYDLHPAWFKCTRDEAILAGLLHDLCKIDGYTNAPDYLFLKGQLFTYTKRPVVNDVARVVMLCAEYGILLDDLMMNALTFAHGAWSVDLSSPYAFSSSRDMKPLAVLLHMADMFSSQLLGYPEKERGKT